MIQSESRTWPAFVAGVKSVTRRSWKPSTAAWYKAGAIFDAWDNAPFRGGRLIGSARVVRAAFQETLRDCPDADYEAEGFAYLNAHPALIPVQARREIWAQEFCSRDAFRAWRMTLEIVWVVRFEIIHIEDTAIRRLEQMLAGQF